MTAKVAALGSNPQGCSFFCGRDPQLQRHRGLHGTRGVRPDVRAARLSRPDENKQDICPLVVLAATAQHALLSRSFPKPASPGEENKQFLSRLASIWRDFTRSAAHVGSARS
jgi:hypothetical protein